MEPGPDNTTLQHSDPMQSSLLYSRALASSHSGTTPSTSNSHAQSSHSDRARSHGQWSRTPPSVELTRSAQQGDQKGVLGGGDVQAGSAEAVVSSTNPTSIRSTGDSSHHSWALDPASIHICKRSDGQPLLLGQGGFGSVYRATQDDIRTVAVKVLSTTESSNAQTKSFWAEIELIAELRDKHIVQFFGAAMTEGSIMLCTEFCERGDLFHAIRSQQVPHAYSILSWYGRGWHIALDVARGLHYLHSNHVIHFDLKSPNVLLTHHFDAKIADVGQAYSLSSRTHLSYDSRVNFRGTWHWQAPEIILGRPATTAVDIWPMGIILHELMTGEVPQRGKMRRPRVPEEGPLEALELMHDCMAEDPSKRPTAKEVVTRLVEIAKVEHRHR